MSGQPLQWRSECGVTWVELAVSIALIATFAGLLLKRVHYNQEAAEKVRIKLEVSKLKVALQARIGAHLAERRPVDAAGVGRPPQGRRAGDRPGVSVARAV